MQFCVIICNMDSYITFNRIFHLVPNPEKFQRHCHTEFEIYLFLGGNAEFLIENKIYKLKPYDLFFIRPSQYHVLQLKGKEAYDRVVCNFPVSMVNDEILPDSNFEYFNLEKDSMFAKQIVEFSAKTQSYTEDDKKRAFLCTLTLILLELKYYSQKHQSEINYESIPLIDKIIKYINKHLTENLTISKLSSSLFVSPSHLCHVFSQHMKISLIQYIRQKKIMYAHSLITSGIKPTKAAELCNFNSYPTFYKAYMKILGSNPKAHKTKK